MKKKTFLSIALLVAVAVGVSPVLAAEFGVSPLDIAMSMRSGESGSTTVIGNVLPPPTAPFTLSLQLRIVGGSMPTSWLAAPPANYPNRIGPLLLPLTVTVPATAGAGTYTAFVQPRILSASIPLSPAARPLQLTVTVTSRCSAPPTVAIASTLPQEFKSPNGRLEDVSVAGNILVPAGCTLARSWYSLTDEYGLLGETRDIAAGADGAFAFTAPVQVSRRGDDKDGRSYQFTVFATDEAGSGSSAPATVVVLHDQRGGRK